MQFWNHYPPQHPLVLPQPRLRWEAPPYFCRPQWLVQTASHQIESLAFFVALHLPNAPGVLQIESLHVFVEQPTVIQAIKQQWQQLALLAVCHQLKVRSVELYGDNLIYPSTGFCTSPSNPPLVPEKWFSPEHRIPIRQSCIWRLSKPQTASHPQEITVKVLDTQKAAPPWPWYSVGERLKIQTGSEQPPLICRRYVNLYPAIQHYGRIPELLQPGDWPATECHLEIESLERTWDSETLSAVVAHLSQEGYQQYEIIAPNSTSWLVNGLWNGRIQAKICEWEI